MPARDSDNGAGRVDARALDDALVDGALETEHRPANVANGGEATHQGVGSFVAGQEIVVTDITERLCRGRAYQHRMPVIVDQAGHQRAAAAIDDRGRRASIDRNRCPGNCFDQLASNQHVRWFGQRCALAVEYPDIVEQRYWTAGLLGLCCTR